MNVYSFLIATVMINLFSLCSMNNNVSRNITNTTQTITSSSHQNWISIAHRGSSTSRQSASLKIQYNQNSSGLPTTSSAQMQRRQGDSPGVQNRAMMPPNQYQQMGPNGAMNIPDQYKQQIGPNGAMNIPDQYKNQMGPNGAMNGPDLYHQKMGPQGGMNPADLYNQQNNNGVAGHAKFPNVAPIMKLDSEEDPMPEKGPKRDLLYNPNRGYEMYWYNGHWVYETVVTNDDSACGHLCLPMYKDYGEICGRNKYYRYRTFDDYCEMKADDCNKVKEWTVVHRGECNPYENNLLDWGQFISRPPRTGEWANFTSHWDLLFKNE